MEEHKIKKKITVKGKSEFPKKLILKKQFLIKESITSPLILEKEIKYDKKVTDLNELNKNNTYNFFSFKKDKKEENILKCSNISKNINGKPILKNININLKRGEILGLLGPNGAGKSTLFNLIIGKLTPDYGEIKLHGENINQLAIHERSLKGISLLEQHKGLFGKMTAYENLYAILELHIKNKDKIDTEIYKLLSFFGLQYLSNVKADNMSGGEYKKISTLQRVCNKNIKILLLDEPMAALDPISISSIKKFILELRAAGLSIIITDHNFFAIYDILDNCVLIKDGSLLIEGKPREIVNNEDVKKYYLGSSFKF